MDNLEKLKQSFSEENRFRLGIIIFWAVMFVVSFLSALSATKITTMFLQREQYDEIREVQGVRKVSNSPITQFVMPEEIQKSISKCRSMGGEARIGMCFVDGMVSFIYD